MNVFIALSFAAEPQLELVKYDTGTHLHVIQLPYVRKLET